MNEEKSIEKYAIRLFVKHPDIDPKEITRALGLKPSHSWMPGSPKIMPHGKVLPAIAKDSYWNYSEIVEGATGFSKELGKLLELLEANRGLLDRIRKTSGEVEIDVQFYGAAHIGDVIEWESLQRMAELKIDLGVEVFPDWN